MPDIPQTNRTLLFEEINPEKPDLLSIIGNVRDMDSLSDDLIQLINKELLVSSFQEFLDKFQPKVYNFFDSISQTVKYTSKRPEGFPDNLVTEIPLTMHNDFFRMLVTLIDTKRSMGTKNVDFKFETVLDQITPKKVMEDIRQLRKEMQYTYGQYAALEEGDPKRRDIGDKLNLMFEEASVNYNNVLAMLPLAIEDCQTRLLMGGAENGGKSEKIAAGVLKMGEDGSLKVLEAPKVDETALALTDNNSNQGLIAALEDDYEAINGAESSDYVKALVVRSFCPLVAASQQEVDVALEVKNHNDYLAFYNESKIAFIKAVKPLVEKMLGVREFFNQYTVKGRGMHPKLLITNCSPEMMAKSSNLPRLLTYLNTVNSKNDYENTIWNAILPNVSMAKTEGKKLSRMRFEGNLEVEHTNVNSMETLAMLLNAIHPYRVKVFFSFEAQEETTFNRIATDGVDSFIDRCEPLMEKVYSSYAVPCLPNMTIVPKDKSGVVTGTMMVQDGEGAKVSEEKEDISRLWIEGVYLGAAYVAAGYMAACQCPEFLKDHFRKNVDPEFPGVRFDVEGGNNALQVQTTLAKEITGFTQTVKSEINRKNFGFIFASENAKFDGRIVDRLTVYKARSLGFDGKTYEPIFQTQVESYFDRIFRQATSDYKQDNIISFFSSNPNSQMSQWMSRREMVNSIIRVEDEIHYEIDETNGTCDIQFVFGGNSRNLQVQLLRRSTSGAKA